MRVRLKVEKLRQLIADSSLSQNHWAIKLGISRGHWSALVNGRHPYPSPKTRHRMLEVFGLQLGDLFEVGAGPTTWHDVDVRSALGERYLIDRELGQGAMGNVYLARDVTYGRLVAIKVLAPEAVCGVGVKAFLREISLVAKLQHPNILPLFDSGVAAEHPYYVMPWIRGGSLRERIQRESRLALADALAIATGMADALTYAHQEHVLHCDVKPANTLLHGNHAYLMDFGISRILHAEVSEWRARRGLDVSAGTPAYVSPEQAEGRADLDGRADVYSLACVIYEMLAGRAPFEGTTTESLVARRFLGPPDDLREYAPELPGAVAAAIEAGMQVERDRRPGSPTELVARVAAARRRHPVLHHFSVRISRVMSKLQPGRNDRAGVRVGKGLLPVMQDFRLIWRGLRRSPWFAMAFVLPLALGLGAGTTFYGVIDYMLYRPPAGVRSADQLVGFGITVNGRDPFATGNIGMAWIDYLALRQQSTALSSVAAQASARMSLGRGEDARMIPVRFATPSLFSLAGVAPQVGRFFTEAEDQTASSLVPCVAGDRFWRTSLGADRAALGRTLQLGKIYCTIVGVAPKGFHGIAFTRADLWIPLRAGAQTVFGEGLWNTDGSHWLRIYGRLRPGATLAAVNEGANRAYRSIAQRTRDRELKEQMLAQPLLGRAVGNSQRFRLARWLVGGAIALILLVGANLVNLLVARNLGRARETGIRMALGGGLRSLLRFHLLESVVLAGLAGVTALLVVHWTGPVARAALFPQIEFASGLVTARVVVLAFGAALVFGVGVALVTTLHAGKVNPISLLSAGGGVRETAGRRTRRARLGLVGIQAALSVGLLGTSLGFVRSFREAVGSNLGFTIKGLVQAEVPPLEFDSAAMHRHRELYFRLHQRIRKVPGVESASIGYTGPWWNNRNEPVAIPGRDTLPEVPSFRTPFFDAVTPDYLQTLQLHLLAGRWISDGDVGGNAPVVVVNEALARLYWPGESAVGKCIQIGTGEQPCRQIVGVVADHRFTGTLDDPPVPGYFLPAAQAESYRWQPKLFIRGRGDLELLLPTIRRVIQGFESVLPAASVQPVQDQFDPLLGSWRLGAAAFTALGAVAAVVAAAGLFSVLAYFVAERRREFAIRSALGAQGGQIVRPVVTTGLFVVGAGAAAGIGLLWGASHWIQPLLFQVRLLEPLVLAGVALGLTAIAVLASLGPARTAGRLDPMEVLRAE